MAISHSEGDLIAAIYDAVIDPSGWDEVVKRVVETTNSVSGNLFLHQADPSPHHERKKARGSVTSEPGAAVNVESGEPKLRASPPKGWKGNAKQARRVRREPVRRSREGERKRFAKRTLWKRATGETPRHRNFRERLAA
jgi:hypothetical protein